MLLRSLTSEAQARGVQLHDLLSFSSSQSDGYHAVAQGHIEAGETLLIAPLSACYDLSGEPTTRDARSHRAGDAASSPPFSELLEAGCPPVCVSALMLANALAGNEKGALGAYHLQLLCGLPQIGNVADWTAVHAAMLRGTALERALDAMPLRERWHSIVLPFITKHSDKFGKTSALTEESFIRAAALVMSRCFHAQGDDSAAPIAATTAASEPSSLSVPGNGGPVLVPVADLFNHSPSTSAHTMCARAGDTFVFRALRPISRGEQVFLSYGALSDASLLRTYGYMAAPPTLVKAAPVDPDTQSQLASALAGNPSNSVHIGMELVIRSLRAAFQSGKHMGDGLREQAENTFDVAVAAMVDSGVISQAGFTLQLPLDDPRRQPGWQSAVDKERALPSLLSAILPVELLTASQVLGADASTAHEYAVSARNIAPTRLLLPLATPLEAIATATAGNGDDDDADVDDVLFAWTTVQRVIAARLAEYPSSLSADRAWDAAVVKAMQSGNGETRSPSKKARRGSVAKPLSGDPWQWPLEFQIAAAVTDSTYRQCRVLAMREKELLLAVCASIVSSSGNLRGVTDSVSHESGIGMQRDLCCATYNQLHTNYSIPSPQDAELRVASGGGNSDSDDEDRSCESDVGSDSSSEQV